MVGNEDNDRFPAATSWPERPRGLLYASSMKIEERLD